MISYSNNYALLQRLDNAGSVDTSRRQKKLRKTERDMEKDNRGRSKENGENLERSTKDSSLDRNQWRGLVSALCATGREEDRYVVGSVDLRF